MTKTITALLWACYTPKRHASILPSGAAWFLELYSLHRRHPLHSSQSFLMTLSDL